MRSWIVLVVAGCDARSMPAPPPPPLSSGSAVRADAIELDAAGRGSVAEEHQRVAGEAVITIAPVQGLRDRPIAAALRVVPRPGYHINLDLQPRLELAPPAGVTLAPITLTTWNATELQMTTTMTAHEAGAYELHGNLHFAVCQADRCFPKIEPIAIAVDVR